MFLFVFFQSFVLFQIFSHTFTHKHHSNFQLFNILAVFETIRRLPSSHLPHPSSSSPLHPIQLLNSLSSVELCLSLSLSGCIPTLSFNKNYFSGTIGLAIRQRASSTLKISRVNFLVNLCARREK